MKCLTSDELRQMYLDFFKSKGHAVIRSASLIPENDPTVLFTTAGMHPLVPYLMGEKHPAGTRLTDVQKCVRTGDIDEVGDESHCTFFEMLGNWSLGDYFKKEAIAWSYEFLTSDEWLGIEKDKLYFTCFAGDEDAPRDMEAYDRWREMGVSDDHIFFLEKKHNWWGPAGITGPCGPDSEMFIDTGKPACGPDCSPACDCGKYLEIWNDVFMEYNKQADGTFVPLEQKNVDTGMGLDRTIAILQGKKSVYETDVFAPIIAKIEALSGNKYEGADEETRKAFRIVADHIRCATFMIGDERGITPSNVDQGYVLRRLLRRAIRFAGKLGIAEGNLSKISKVVIDKYAHAYDELHQNEAKILAEIEKEEERFQKTIVQGLKEFEKVTASLAVGDLIDGKSAFRLYDTFGFPIEFTLELADERGFKVDKDGFDKAFEHHQELSHAGAEQRFSGGLADTSEQTARLHTATHLLNAALRKLLSDDITQKGSNITAERLRFDFNFDRKVERDELDKLEEYVNEAIGAGLDVVEEEMTVDEAKEQGAMGVFDSKYGELVKVYTIPGYSKEICGGPHAKNTAELGHFKIKKEQSSSAGVRRIKAVLD
ncbi:MAG: alanine--tRNA ligase [Christensenella sp.]|uniref:alanine--tRNA ligase n=1 Tax=Christensenella sp. TaxID=1935934 RepID=UPI002B21F339|nr:alanine--tRNA ligase [Christensenella sp.]MEA5003315.1 alanine--tRNA ligase [Christensenella sp.]